jgi:hypothetical protein
MTECLGCHGTRYVRHARGWYACPVRAVRGALGASRPAPTVRTLRGRLVRVARTYPTEAPGRTRQLSRVLLEQLRVGGEDEGGDALKDLPDGPGWWRRVGAG